jgi:hypothetical protein
MTRTLHAKYDGEALHPEEPLPIAPETRVLITVDTEDDREPEFTREPVQEGGSRVEDEGNPYAFLDVLRSLRLEGPPDWSQRVGGAERDQREEPAIQHAPAKGEPYSFLRYAESLSLEGPEDWSERLEDYLYAPERRRDD